MLAIKLVMFWWPRSVILPVFSPLLCRPDHRFLLRTYIFLCCFLSSFGRLVFLVEIFLRDIGPESFLFPLWPITSLFFLYYRVFVFSQVLAVSSKSSLLQAATLRAVLYGIKRARESRFQMLRDYASRIVKSRFAKGKI
jgi:uncharacterized membrane protein